MAEPPPAPNMVSFGIRTFHSPIPSKLHTRIAYLISDQRFRNKAEFLFSAVNALSRELGLPELEQECIVGFSPYPEPEGR